MTTIATKLTGREFLKVIVRYTLFLIITATLGLWLCTHPFRTLALQLVCMIPLILGATCTSLLYLDRALSFTGYQTARKGFPPTFGEVFTIIVGMGSMLGILLHGIFALVYSIDQAWEHVITALILIIALGHVAAGVLTLYWALVRAFTTGHAPPAPSPD